MTRAALTTILHHARALAGAAADLPESLLLERFLAQREEAAFAALVERHGAMVLGVCRRLLGNTADAEDAFQATFLVLARQAAALRKRASLASWLYGIACRVAWRARADTARRRRHERQAQALRPATAAAEPAGELGEVLAEELERLPEKYRSAVVLCHLEGRTNEEAARHLGWPVGSVKGRLARARDLLRARLTRRGFAPSAALFATARAADAVSPALSQGTVRAALATSLGMAAEGVAHSVVALAEGAFQPAAWVRLRLTLALLLLLAALGGVGALGQGGTAARPPDKPARPAPAAPAAVQGAPAPADLHGDPLPPGARARLGTVRFRQAGLILTLAHSADGKVLASAGWGQAVCLWDAATGRRLRKLPGHDRLCATLAFSPDGKLLASGGYDRLVRVADVASGKEVHVFRDHRLQVNSVAFSPDGKLLASGGQDSTLILWNVATGKAVRRLKDVPRQLGQIAFAPDGKLLLGTGHDHALHLWDVASGRRLRRLLLPDGARPAAVFTPDGKLLALGNRGGDACLWDAVSGKLLRTWPTPAGPVQSIALSPNGKLLAIAYGNGTLLPREPQGIRLWDVAAGQEASRLADDTGAFHALAFTPDGRTLAASDGSAVRRWDLASGKELLPGGGHRSDVFSVAITADGKNVFSGSEDGPIRRWDTATGKEGRALAGHRSGVLCVRLIPDCKLLASAGLDGNVYLWDPDGARPRRELPAHPSLRTLALAPDGQSVVTSADGKGLRFWDTAGKELRAVAPHQLFFCLAFAPDGKALASGGYEAKSGYQNLQVWDVATGRKIGGTSGLQAVAGVASSPDGRWVAAALHGEDDQVRLHDARGKEVRRFRGHRGSALDVAFAPGGWMLASAGQDATVRLWEVATGLERRRLEGHTGRVNCVAFAADGRTLVSGGADTTVLVWDPARSSRAAGQAVLSAAELEKCWTELAAPDAGRAYDAVCLLSAFPGQAVPLLRERLLGGKVAVGRVAQWLRELDDPGFAVREKASGELRKRGRQVEPELRRALAGASPEARLRLERLLAALPGAGGTVHDSGRIRSLRGLEVLERIGTPQAIAAVEVLARGQPDALRTQEARAVLERVKRRAGGGR